MLTGVISYLDENSNGVLMAGKDRVYVRHVFAKEKVKVQVNKRLKEGYGATLVQVIEPNKDRVKPKCGIFEKCGSCQLMHMNAASQKELKLQYLQTLCKKEKNLSIKAQNVLTMKDPYHYRNKMIIGFQKNKQGQIQAGFYEEFTHTIIPYKTCLLHPEICDDIVATIVTLMKKLRIEPYDEDKRKGMLRHVLLRYGKVSKEIMVVLVVNQAVFPARKAFVQELLNKHPEITTVIQNTNTRKTSVVLGDQERVLYGPGFISDTLCGLQYHISAKSFYQINHEQCEVLYKKGMELLQLKGNEKVMDAYCGIGTIGMYASQFAKEVIGVEVNKDAVEDAKENARLNNIKNIRFICDDATAFIQKEAGKRAQYDVVILDPPRAGSTDAFIDSVARLNPKKVLYISCNPQTQMRDLNTFKRKGYETSTIEGVDMFPQTFHTESICLLTRMNQRPTTKKPNTKSNPTNHKHQGNARGQQRRYKK